MQARLCATLLMVTVLIVGMGCRSSGGGAAAPEQEGDALSVALDDYEDALEKIVRKHIESANRAGGASKLIRQKPYFFKEYSEYPGGAEGYRITYSEKDSRTRPLGADVRLKKIRYATQLHRDRNTARDDEDYFRSTGDETLTFELRNGRWTRVGSMFVAAKTEKKVDGVWAPREETVGLVATGEDDRGWFGRTWDRLRGNE